VLENRNEAATKQPAATAFNERFVFMRFLPDAGGRTTAPVDDRESRKTVVGRIKKAMRRLSNRAAAAAAVRAGTRRTKQAGRFVRAPPSGVSRGVGCPTRKKQATKRGIRSVVAEG
jgi:hypothetical protein